MMDSASSIFDTIGDGLLIHDPETGEILDANSTYLEMHGYDRSELVGETVEVVSAPVPEYSEATALARIQQAHRTGQVRFEWRNRRADGGTFPVEVILSQMRCDGNERVLASVRDISERKEYEERYQTAKRHLDAILEATKFGLFLKNTDHEYLLMNDRVKNMFGLDELPPGTTDFDVVPEEAARRFQADDKQVLETEEPLRVEEEVPERGGIRTYLTIKVPAYDEHDELYGVAGFTQDITEKKERERELQETKQELEASNERLDKFASMVSHDLRNPLNVASLRAHLLAEEHDDENIAAVQNALDRMEGMIDELLTLARAGDTIEPTDEHPLANLAEQAWENVQTDGAELDNQIENVAIRADSSRMLHVFENLFRNALDHNDTPLTVRVGSLGANHETVTDSRGGFFVEDNGTGIPEDDRGEIFERGYTTSESGTGYGLAVVQEIVDAHGWTIRATAGTDGGARFEITDVEIAA